MKKEHNPEYINSTNQNKLINLELVPTNPGCYLFYDNKGKIIYIGKANNLRSRIRTYLQNADNRYHIRFLLSRAQRIDYIITNSEREALLLENTLIKRHKPRYNIRLKDDKNYLSLRLDPSDDFPRLTFVRKPKKDNALYFGPFHSASTIREVYKQLHFIVPLRRCSDGNFHNRTRPCLYYQMGTCPAPCVNYISKEQYSELVQQAILLLQGKAETLEKELSQQIKRLSEKLEFEQAGLIRDRLFALRKIMEPQQTILFNQSRNIDVWGIYSSDNNAVIHILFYQNGKLVGSRAFSIVIPIEIPLNEFLSSILLDVYTQKLPVPAEILLPVEIDDVNSLTELLIEKTGKKVQMIHPKRGIKEELLKLASKNAEAKFLEERKLQASKGMVLQEIQKLLHLPKIPKRIECFDASTFQGDSTVVGMVVFENGIPNKSHYRRFAIDITDANDDYYALRNALTRRYTDLTDLPMPDLLLIDGGKGQLNVATSVLNDLKITEIVCASIAKARTYPTKDMAISTQDRFFIPNRSNPIIIRSKNSPALLLLQQIRDETHRFSIQYHRKRRSQKFITHSKRPKMLNTSLPQQPKD